MTPVPPVYLQWLCAAPVTRVEYGCGGIELDPPEAIESAQRGYGGHDWSPTWLVIGRDTALGDPIFIDTAKPHLPVFTAMHGEGAWRPRQIADSFRNFLRAMMAFKGVSSGREHPAKLEKKPLIPTELADYKGELKRFMSSEEVDFWLCLVDAS